MTSANERVATAELRPIASLAASRIAVSVAPGLATPGNPMSFEEVAAKALDLMSPVVGNAKAKALIEQISRLGGIDNIRSLRGNLQTG